MGREWYGRQNSLGMPYGQAHFFSTDLGWSKNMFSEDMSGELAAIRVLKRSELA